MTSTANLPPSFRERFLSASGMPIHYVRSKDKSGIYSYFFLMCDLRALDKLKQASLKAPFVDLSEYGRIIFSGYGAQPAKQHIAYLRDKYAVDFSHLLKA